MWRLLVSFVSLMRRACRILVVDSTILWRILENLKHVFQLLFHVFLDMVHKRVGNRLKIYHSRGCVLRYQLIFTRFELYGLLEVLTLRSYVAHRNQQGIGFANWLHIFPQL
jgi:hypothetical protein